MFVYIYVMLRRFECTVRVCAKQETQEVRRQIDRQMDRQGQDPAPLQGHSAKIFDLKCSGHLRSKVHGVLDILPLFSSMY